MSFSGAGSSEPGMAFKKFVSEDELEEKRKKRQEEWEKVRKPEDPVGMVDYVCSWKNWFLKPLY